MKKEKEYHPCSKEKGFCVSLERVTQPDGHQKGLSFFNVFNHETETIKILTLGIIYRENQRDRGILLNYCPFCGEDLRPFREEHTKEVK